MGGYARAPRAFCLAGVSLVVSLQRRAVADDARAVDPPALVGPRLFVPEPPSANEGPLPARLPPPSSVGEVTITGTRVRPTSSPTEERLGRADIRLVPGAFGDPFRAIDALPGLVPTVSGLPYYYVRGAPPSAIGYFVDEVRVPYLFHFALGPGVIQPALIDEVSLHPAAFPGRFGRFAGAVVAGKTREPASDLYGEANLRVFDAGAYVEAPFANDRATAAVGGRYSYTAGLFSLVAPDTTIDYRDYNARASYSITDRWRLSTLVFGSYDYASQVDDGKPEVLFASEFHRVDVRLDRLGANGATTRIATTLGFDRTRLEGSRFANDLSVGARARHRESIARDVEAEIGIDTLVERYSGDPPSVYAVGARNAADAAALFSPRLDTATGVWASATWHPKRGFELTATARADLFSSAGVTAVGPSPRVSMRVPITPKVAFLGALGVAAQPPAFTVPIPAVGYRGLPGGIGFGYQKSAGAEVELPIRFSLRAIGFHHSYFNLRDFTRDSGNFNFDDPLAPRSPTQAYGLEVHLGRKLSERFGAFVSYTLSRSELGSTSTALSRVSPFDRTHVLQIGGSADLGSGWRTSARLLTYRGWPDEGTELVPNGPPKRRLSPFTRLDARIEKRWRLRKTGYISVVLEALNATASKEIIKRECSSTDGCRDREIGPVVAPSLGVEGAL